MVDPEYPADDDDLPHTSRRGLLTGAAGLLGIGAAATVLGPVALFLGHPLEHDTTSSSDAYLPVGPPSLFVGPAPVKVDLFADKVDAWNRVVKVKVGSAWVMRKESSLVAYSTVCPHLGCGIDYDGGANKFYCACHKSWFTLDGAVEEGPSPRAMDELEIQAAEQLVSIRYQRFKQGVEHKEPA
ncbi:MAG: Rieske 2Fe-2S domain-containing protein [Deltaproteobacteria bacterium]|nr:Rieske 2Fe-2S domain-containing protein [Nannocystaceae bacterium]